MCGIVGFLQNRRGGSDPGGVLRSMVALLEHRGPDDSGTWMDVSSGVCLGHRRLAIVDLSSNGHQPMQSVSGRYVLTYNGEIYNFREMQRNLIDLGHTFRGNSDTEVLLAAVEEWGIRSAIKRLDGMFAFAMWDAATGALTLGRDRAGEKPLFYGTVGADFVFASELKAIMAYPGFKVEVDRASLASFMRYSYVPAPDSIFTRIKKVPPGKFVHVSDRGASVSTPVAYWSIDQVASEGLVERKRLGASEASRTNELEHLLREAISLQVLADVPSGVFLSGGIDSTTIAALAQVQSERAIKTFSIGFTDPRYDESARARAVAAHLGTEHTEHRVTPAQVLEVIPELPPGTG